MLRVRALAAVLLLSVALGGCPSLTERSGLPPSVDRAAQLESSGDPAAAGRMYEELAAHNTGADRDELLLDGARAYLRARRAEDAARLLAGTEAALPAPQTTLRALLNVQLALERGQREEAARQLAAIPEPHGAPLDSLYQELRGQLNAPVAAHRPPAPQGTRGAA